VPAYVLFNDATLREMARIRPGSPGSLLGIRGVGERKLADLGEQFLEAISVYCRENRLPLDV
jgi:ATP-dependent DNA helicase RecQ